MKILFKNFVILTYFLFVNCNLIANQNDINLPINLEADSVEINEKDKISTFKGNVKLTQGNIQIIADFIKVRQNEFGFESGIAEGNPVIFQQKSSEFNEIKGSAKKIEYDGVSGNLVMSGEAIIIKGNNKVQADYISYNTLTEYFKIVGEKKSNNSKRVKATIMPNNK